LGFYCRIQES